MRMRIVGDLWVFIASVVSHWQALVTGSLVTAVAFIVERYRNVQLPWRTISVIFLWASLPLAAFLAWRDKHLEVAQLGLQLSQSSQARALPPDYIALHRPWLEPVLIVSDYQRDSFRVSYEIV